MEHKNILEATELTSHELVETNGGNIPALILAGIGLCFAAYSAGYMTGKAIFS